MLYFFYHLHFSENVDCENLPLVMSQRAMIPLLQVSKTSFQSLPLKLFQGCLVFGLFVFPSEHSLSSKASLRRKFHKSSYFSQFLNKRKKICNRGTFKVGHVLLFVHLQHFQTLSAFFDMLSVDCSLQHHHLDSSLSETQRPPGWLRAWAELWGSHKG